METRLSDGPFDGVGLGTRQLVQSFRNLVAVKVQSGQARIQGVVVGFLRRERLVHLAQMLVLDAVGEDAKALAAPRLDERRDDELVEQRLGLVRANVGHELFRVRRGVELAELDSSLFEDVEHQLEMLHLLAHDPRELAGELGLRRVAEDHRERGRSGPFLEVRVVDEHQVEVVGDAVEPAGIRLCGEVKHCGAFICVRGPLELLCFARYCNAAEAPDSGGRAPDPGYAETMDNLNKDSSQDRRSSVRVRSLLPCALRKLDETEIPALEAQILDLAVLESDGVMHDVADWSERADELPREVVFVLNEIRAMRQQITELHRIVAAQGKSALEPRWLVINDKGLWIPLRTTDPELAMGDFVEVRLQIPSVQTPDILAGGEIVRVGEDDDESGVAVAFRHISQTHKKAIIRYALRRERQLARSLRFH